MRAVRALGVGEQQVIGRASGLRWQAEHFPGLCGPVAVEHDGQAMDKDVEEAADDEAEEEGAWKRNEL